MKILVLSDRMYGGNSAYSKHTFEVCVRLAGLGHKVAHIPMGYANRMGKQVYKGVLVYDSDEYDPFGEDLAIRDYVEFKADLLITNKEPWVFRSIPYQAINFVPIVPLDHAPASGEILRRLTYAFKIIAISRFGQRELKKRGYESIHIPLGVRTDIYQPMNKAECKKAFYFDPEEFVVGIVAMNRSRKMIPQMLRGYKRFLDLNPDVKSHLMLWTNVLPTRPPADTSQGIADVGVSLLPEINDLGLGDKVNWIKWDDVEKIGGLPDFDPTGQWDMVRLYNSFDVNLLCLPPYERIWTNAQTTVAKKRIAHIIKGDHVLTHKGEFRRVTRVLKRIYSGKLIKLSSLYGVDVTLTPNHPVLIRRKGRLDWIPASEVRKEDMMVIPKPKAHLRKLSLSTNRHQYGKIHRFLPWNINFSPELFEFFGYYIAEGNTFLHKATTQFSLHSENDKEIVECIKRVAASWGLVAKDKRGNGHKMKVLIYNRQLAGILRWHFGSHSHKKRLPAWMMRLADERNVLIPKLLKGLWKGDRYHTQTKAEYTTVSRRLAEQVCYLLLREGILPSLKYMKARKAYRIRISGKQITRFGKLIEIELGEAKQKRSQFRSNRNFFFVPVKKVETSDYNGSVYNLQVEDDESYATPLLVHNCSGGEGAGLPYLEAASCGVPSIYTNYAAAPEYAGPCGIPVNAEDYVILNTPGTRFYLADIDGIADALTKIYNADRTKLAKQARAFAEKMAWENIIKDYWVPFLKDCEQELYPHITKAGVSSYN